MLRRFAISYNSTRVFGALAPVRLRCATAEPRLPSAVRFLAGMFEIVFFALAAACALRTFDRAAVVCLLVAMIEVYPACPGYHG